MKSFIITILTLIISLTVFSCDDNPTEPDPGITVTERTDRYLPEDRYFASDKVSLSLDGLTRSGYFRIELDLLEWTKHYDLEVFVMDESEYVKYVNGSNFGVWFHESFSELGSHIYETESFSGGHFRVVLDNTDKGWEDTDWDGSDDIAKYNLNIYLKR